MSETHERRNNPKAAQRRRRGLRDENHLPPKLGEAFEGELDALLHAVAPSLGFKGTYLLSEYKSKYLDSKVCSPDDRRAAAIAKWLSTEGRNSRTNQRLYVGDVDFGWVTSDQLLANAKQLVTRVLGPLHYPFVLWGSWHTNGASTRISRSPSAAAEKHIGVAHVSSSALTHWLRVSDQSDLLDQEMCIQESSVMFTVPKATEIDRVACKEPEINMLLQRAVGNHIRRNLRKEGIDLNDQTHNQRLAQSALKRGNATIDLSSASDSISTMLVRHLLPDDWYNLLDDLRVKSTIVDGEVHELEMFSSMGNGFTFELESLIFWALAHSVKRFSRCRGTVSVYGDDIIVPCRIARRLARIFSWLGFKVNSKKSNWTGSFRESCGKHYYKGFDVTPFFIREPIRKKTDIVRVLNRLLEWDGRGWGFFLTEEFSVFHQKWARIVGPDLFGGQNIDDPYALVTGHAPRKRLVSRKSSVSCSDEGRLLYWFMVREATHPSRREPKTMDWDSWEVDGVKPLTYTPVEEGRHVLAPNRVEYTTTWDPYLLFGSSEIVQADIP